MWVQFPLLLPFNLFRLTAVHIKYKMNQNCYCADLKLDFEIEEFMLRTEDLCDIPAYGFKQFKVDHSSLDAKLVTFLKSMDIKISHAEAFYILPGKSMPIHVDSDVMDNHCKLNFVYGAPGSLMQWWKPLTINDPLPYQLTTIGTRYLKFEKDQCELVWTAQVGRPSIVNTGQPHNVINSTDKPRKALSLVLYDLTKSQMLDWDDAIEKFKQYLF